MTKTKTKTKITTKVRARKSNHPTVAALIGDDDSKPAAKSDELPKALRNLRRTVLLELAKRVRHRGFERSLYGQAYCLEYLADSFSLQDELNLPSANNPLVAAETFFTVEDGDTERHFVLAIKDGDQPRAVWAELKSHFRPL